MHAHVWPKDDVIKREVNREGIVGPSGMPLNVMMIMFDSISHAQFQRKAPSVYRYLKDDENSVILNGQTIVGEFVCTDFLELVSLPPLPKGIF